MTQRFKVLVAFLVLIAGGSTSVLGQLREGPVRIFGYYQNAYEYFAYKNERDYSSFITQQLNLIAQKDLGPGFRSFINFEFLNTFEGSLGWGAASLKEAWVRYDAGAAFKLKVGLHIPIFNGLNDIKTRSPLLPYIVRPIVYETSLGEIINLEEYVPERAFLQAYGSSGSFEYAVFVGNSPNVNNDVNLGQTGVDTTASVLVGGRLGIHWNNFDSNFTEFKLGVSSTFDRVNFYTEVPALFSADPVEIDRLREDFELIPRWRLGGDLALYWKRFYLQAEAISVMNSEDTDQLDVDRLFLYGTLGFIPGERIETYLTYWMTREHAIIRDNRAAPTLLIDESADLDIYSLGVKYILTPRVVLKAQFAVADIHLEADANLTTGEGGEQLRQFEGQRDLFSVYALAISVLF